MEDRRETGDNSSREGRTRSRPGNLLRPWVLLLLRNWQAHGYALQQALSQVGLPDIDQSALYRELRALEAEGLLRSFWDTEHAGPARRIYALTELGERMLAASVADIEQYQGLMARFLQTYLQAFSGVSPAAQSSAKQASRRPRGGRQQGQEGGTESNG